MLPKFTRLSRMVHLPIEDKDVLVTALTVGEQKNLLLNKNQSEQELEEFLIRLINDKTADIDVTTLTLADLVILLLNIIDISSGLTNTEKYKCSNIVDEKECGTEFVVNTDLNDYKIEGKVDNYKIVSVVDNISVEFRYPSYIDIKKYVKTGAVEDIDIVGLLARCISCVYVGEDAENSFSYEEMLEWVKDLPAKVIKEFDSFITDMPYVVHEYEIECPKCHNKFVFRSTSLLDFFTQSMAG